MSNHSGGAMLNDVLNMLNDMKIFEVIEPEKARKVALKIVDIGRRYDCNSGEILEYIGEDLGICYYCLKESDDIEDGLCKDCRGE